MRKVNLLLFCFQFRKSYAKKDGKREKMELKEIKCSNCRNEIYIQQSHVREKMLCTLGCLIRAPENGALI
jgi:ribosomal protein L32